MKAKILTLLLCDFAKILLRVTTSLVCRGAEQEVDAHPSETHTLEGKHRGRPMLGVDKLAPKRRKKDEIVLSLLFNP